ncbi:4-carboxymuconolactone decarboxylase [Desulfarculales bacterium]
MSLPAPYLTILGPLSRAGLRFCGLGEKCRDAGPLAGREVRLVKLGLAVATGSRGGIKSQVRRALQEGLTPEEMRHATLLALPTIDFPTMVAAMDWMDETVEE